MELKKREEKMKIQTKKAQKVAEKILLNAKKGKNINLKMEMLIKDSGKDRSGMDLEL